MPRRYSRRRKGFRTARRYLRGGYARPSRRTNPARTLGLWNGRSRDELKVTDTATVVAAVTQAGVVSLLNGTATGTDYTNRTGRKMITKSVLIRLFINTNLVSAQQGDVVRVIIFVDKQSNGALPAVADVLNTATYAEPMNLNNRDRFIIIRDTIFTMSPAVYAAAALTAGAPVTRMAKHYKKVSFETIFSGTTNGIASIASGSLCILYISQFASVSTITYNVRTRFIDS